MEQLWPIAFILCQIGMGFLLAYLFFVQPVWALIDCAVARDRSQSFKITWILMMLVVGAIGWSLVIFFWLGHAVAVVYSLFATRSGVLRKATGYPLLATLAIGLASVAILITVPESRDSLPQAVRDKLAAGRVDPVTLDDIEVAGPALEPVDPFLALLMTPPGSVSVARFTLEGPEASSAIPVHGDVRQLAADATGSTIYATTRHGVGTIDPSTGEFTELTVDPELPEVSWPVGVAFDSDEGVLLFDSRGPLYTYRPESDTWKTIPNGNTEFTAIVYAPDRKSFYGLISRVGEDYVSGVARLNANAAVIEQIALAQSIPTHSWMDHRVQLAYSSNRLIVLVAPQGGARVAAARANGMRLYVVDPDSGDVRLVAAS